LNSQEQVHEEIRLLKEIVLKLEWSRVERRTDFETGAVSRSFRVCPLCGGVESHGYKLISELHGDDRFHKGHFSSCLFSRIDLSKF
jgi:hypothetical protein